MQVMADVTTSLRWTGEGLRFDGMAGDRGPIPIDADGEAGPSPMETMILGVVGCTATDIVEILGKMRVPLEELAVRVEAERAAEPPRRYTQLRLVYEVRGVPADDEAKLERAIALSHETYCSALHSLRPDVDLSTTVELLD